MLLFFLTSVMASCSSFLQGFACSSFSKTLYATATTALRVPAQNCKPMTLSEWKKVGCHNPSSDRRTKVCVPSTFVTMFREFGLVATAGKNTIMVGKPFTRKSLFNTQPGQEVMLHELTHVRQHKGFTPYEMAYLYITAFCDAGCSYFANRCVPCFSLILSHWFCE